MKYYLGIDGGGTKTTAAVADENGTVLFRAVGKTINFYTVGMERARRNLQALLEAVEEAVDGAAFEAAFIGCSALDGEADPATVEALCGGLLRAKAIGMNSDVFIALRAAESCGSSWVAVCGTGSMAAGRTADGRLLVKGGWGHVLGDEGSAWAIAVHALRRCCVRADNGQSTPLTEAAKACFAVDDLREIIGKIYAPETAKDDVAAFAVRVSALAEAGDGEAGQILRDEATAFAATVVTLLREAPDGALLSLRGGVFENCAPFREAFCEAVRNERPKTEIRLLTVPPEEGALQAARELL